MNPVALGWTLREVAEAVEGTVFGTPDTVIESISTDSRDITEASLFVALVGDTFDGHEFVQETLGDGAAAVLVERSSRISVTPRVEVGSSLEALARLAEKRRSELHIPVVAITGTSGKTTTKDLVAAAIRGSWCSPRSFNNEVGVPLTVLATPDDATALIVEVGSRGVGHIESLTAVVRPDIAVITNLGVGHMETFGSPLRLRDAKFELIEMLDTSGVAVVPASEPTLAADAGASTVTFTASASDVHADVRVSHIELDGAGLPSFTCSTPAGRFEVNLRVPGLHQADNAAAAIGVAVALDLPMEAFVSGMESAVAAAWRMEIHRGRFTVVNDAYNANPQSVKSALATVDLMDGGHIAVLGPMAELGPLCEREHVRIGELVAALDYRHLVVVGEDHGYGLGYGVGVLKAIDIESAADILTAIVEPGDVVLVKASRSASLERLALQLVEDSAS